MAGYSGTPLVKKIGIKPGDRVAVVNSPDGFVQELGPLPNGVVEDHCGSGRLNVILLFARDRLALERELPCWKGKLLPTGMLWAAWPKRASGVQTDLSESSVQKAGLALGLVDTKVCAINDIWSGLKFVVPLTDRAEVNARARKL